MAKKECDIPGFFRDPETGRYFREKPGDAGNSSLKKIKLEVESKTATKVRPSKITNVVNFLRLKELGSYNGVVAESEFCKKMVMANSKTEIMSEQLSITMNGEQKNMASVELIAGGKKSNIGFWKRVGDSQGNILMERNFFSHRDDRRTNVKLTNGCPVDLCECPNNLVVYVYNRASEHSSGLHIFKKYRGRQTILEIGYMVLFCCSPFADICAAGGENCIRLFGLHSQEDKIKLEGRVHTLSSNEDGNLLSAGLHDGRILLYDIRTKKVASEIRGLQTCIVESAFRKNSSYGIFAGLPDRLFEVDFRENKVVTTYSGHCQTQAKKHISMSDNMLCVTGSDNIIRIWHTSGGSPIFQKEPIHNPKNAIRGWLNQDGNKTYLNYFEAELHKVFKIL